MLQLLLSVRLMLDNGGDVSIHMANSFSGISIFRMETVHYSYVMMSAIASQIISLTIVYPSVYSGANQRKYQNSALLATIVRLVI